MLEVNANFEFLRWLHLFDLFKHLIISSQRSQQQRREAVCIWNVEKFPEFGFVYRNEVSELVVAFVHHTQVQ